MKCFSKNELKTFYFHDAGLKEIKFDTYDIIMLMNGVCVEPENSQNKESYAVITDYIKFIFKNAKIVGIKKICPSPKEAKIISENEYGFVIDGFQDGGDIYYGGYDNDDGKYDNDTFVIELFNCENDFFDIYISYDEVTAEWEYTSDKAWYVKD